MQKTIKGYVTIIVFPQRSYEVLNRTPSDPEVSEEMLLPVLVGWAQGHAPIIDKPTGYRLEYWMEDSLHYQWYEGEDLLEGEGTETVLEPVDESEEATLERLRAERAEAVSKITVTVDGMVFDGDETSQERMARTITAAVATGEDMTAMRCGSTGMGSSLFSVSTPSSSSCFRISRRRRAMSPSV